MPLPSPSLPYTVMMFLIVLTVLVFVHEMGHYLVARLFNTRVEVFSIGFGREIFGWYDKKGTRWKISAIPLGGYVKFFGDANVASDQAASADDMTAEERSVAFFAKPVYQRAAIVAAGPIINFVFAAAIFAVWFGVYGQPYTPAHITAVVESSPAAAAGFKAGDKVLAVDGASIDTFEQLADYVQVHPGVEIEFSVDRAGTEIILAATPAKVMRQDAFGGKQPLGQLGVQGEATAWRQLGPVGAVGAGVDETLNMTWLMWSTLRRMVVGNVDLDQLGGPLRIAEASGKAAALGFPALVQLVAFISISLGFMNLLPIPVLDGGHLAFYAFEAVRGRPASRRTREYASLAGLAAVLILFVFVTWNDLNSFGVWDKLSKLFS